MIMNGFLSWRRMSGLSKLLLITRKHFQPIGVMLGWLRSPEPPAIIMIFTRKYAKRQDLAETIRMIQSRVSGRPSLSRYGHFCIDNLPFLIRATTNP